MSAGDHRAARVARAATSLCALQRRRESSRRVRPPRARGSGDKPRVGHGGGVFDGGLERRERALLANDVVPNAGHSVCLVTVASTAATTSAKTSSTERAASITAYRSGALA